jgi:hypothetical protein
VAVVGVAIATWPSRSIGLMDGAAGFEFQRRGDEILIRHHGKDAVTLRGAAAAKFLHDVDQGDPQDVMARATGNYRRGNERVARQHPRNR